MRKTSMGSLLWTGEIAFVATHLALERETDLAFHVVILILPDYIDRDLHRRNRSSVLKSVCGVRASGPVERVVGPTQDSQAPVGAC